MVHDSGVRNLLPVRVGHSVGHNSSTTINGFGVRNLVTSACRTFGRAQFKLSDLNQMIRSNDFVFREITLIKVWHAQIRKSYVQMCLLMVPTFFD